MFNNKLSRFVAKYKDSLAEAVYALVALWGQYTPIICLFSPENLNCFVETRWRAFW